MQSSSAFLLLLHHVLLACSSYLHIDGLPREVYQSEGKRDIYLGGMFPIHDHGDDEKFCGKLRELGVLQRVEAMPYYIDHYNREFNLTFQMGFYILDDCYTQKTALAQALHFVQSENMTCTNNNCVCENPDAIKSYDVIGVIGSESSSVSIELAQLFGLFQLPQISYLSTANSLTDSNKYPYFNRVPSPDRNQIDIMKNLFQIFKWEYFSMVFSSNDYGRNGFSDMVEIIGNTPNLCMDQWHSLSLNAGDEDFKDILTRLNGTSTLRRPKPRVVVLFINQPQAQGFLKMADKLRLHGEFTWVGSDAWGRSLPDFEGIESISNGSLHIKVKSSSEMDFNAHFRSLNPKNHTSNPWFNEFWETHHNCTGQCLEHLRFGTDSGWMEETTISLLKEAVRSFAVAVELATNLCKKENSGKDCTIDQAKPYLNATNIQRQLRSKRCPLPEFDKCLFIDEKGNGNHGYTIQNFYTNEKPVLQVIAAVYYDEPNRKYSNIQIAYKSIKWSPKVKMRYDKELKIDIPISTCSDTCGTHQQQLRDPLNGKCCWDCHDCLADQKSVSQYDNRSSIVSLVCEDCSALRSADEKICIYQEAESDVCYPIIPQVLSWKNALSIGLVVLNYIFLSCIVVVLILYIKNGDRSLIKATSKELSYVTFTGTFFALASTILFFISPITGCSDKSHCKLEEVKALTYLCYIQYSSFCLSFTMTYAPILTRIIRIHRIFSEGKKSAKRPRFIERKYQMGITVGFILFQVLILLVSVIISVVRGTDIAVDSCTSDANLKGIVTCKLPINMLLPPVIYNLLIVVGCAVFAFKTRKLPDNFNEARFIAFCVYTACIMWVAFLTVYFLLENHLYRVVPLVVVMAANAIVPIVTLFIPKIYAIYFVSKHKMNIRTASVSEMGPSSGNNSRRSSRFAGLSDSEQFNTIPISATDESTLSGNNMPTKLTDITMVDSNQNVTEN